MKQVLVGCSPRTLKMSSPLISLYRPGPMDSIPTYLRNRTNPDKISYKTPQLAHILDVTNGCIVYQEQVMQIFRELAGFSFGQADNVRRAMSKKEARRHGGRAGAFCPWLHRARQRMPRLRRQRHPGAGGKQIYDEMSSFASYAFNKSPRGLLRLCGFPDRLSQVPLPREFMAALLTSVLDNTDKVIEYSAECQRWASRCCRRTSISPTAALRR